MDFIDDNLNTRNPRNGHVLVINILHEYLGMGMVSIDRCVSEDFYCFLDAFIFEDNLYKKKVIHVTLKKKKINYSGVKNK